MYEQCWLSLDFLARFAQAAGLNRYYLMGTSMGANMAAHHTTRHPEQVLGLIFVSPFGLRDQAGRMRQIKRWDEVLPQIGQSVLILIGSEDKLLCAEDRDKLHQLLAREQLEIIEESGHFLYLDSTEIVSSKIVAFTRGGRE